MRFTFWAILLFMGLLLSSISMAQNWQWARGNTGSGMDGWAIATDQKGNVFAGGVAFGPGPVVLNSISVPFSSGGTGNQCMIAKYDGSGNIQWANSTKNGNTSLINIAADQAGNSFMLGTFNSKTVDIGAMTLTNSVYPESQYFIAKYDASGTPLWARNAGNSQNYYLVVGGIATVFGTGAITTDAPGNVYIAINFHLPSVTVGSVVLYNFDLSGNTNDILLVKYTPSGTVAWAKSVGTNTDDEAYGITVTPAGNIYIAGMLGAGSITFGSSVITNANTSPNQVAFIGEFDAAGSPAWASASGGTGKEYAIGLQSDFLNNVYLTGGFKDNSIAFNGATVTNPVPGGNSLYLVKFDQANNVNWYKTIYSYSKAGAIGYSIAMSQCGIVWVSGAMGDSVIIDGHTLKAPLLDSMLVDPVFVAGYNANGIYIGSAALPSGGDDQNGISCDPTGNLYMCSDYWSSRRFVAGADTLPKDSGNELLYVAKYPYIKVNSENFKHSSQTTDCIGGGITLNAPDGYTSYFWNDGHQSPSYNITDTGIYCVHAFDSCSTSSSDTFIIHNNCVCGKTLFLPNSFTPNGDGQNDIFYPRSANDVKMVKSFRIYSRWGELLFERENIFPNDASNAWDGTYSGDKPRPDVYVWVIDAICSDNNELNKKGSVTIIR
jgi:gliding motility-associated-like protein